MFLLTLTFSFNFFKNLILFWMWVFGWERCELGVLRRVESVFGLKMGKDLVLGLKIGENGLDFG